MCVYIPCTTSDQIRIFEVQDLTFCNASLDNDYPSFLPQLSVICEMIFFFFCVAFKKRYLSPLKMETVDVKKLSFQLSSQQQLSRYLRIPPQAKQPGVLKESSAPSLL